MSSPEGAAASGCCGVCGAPVAESATTCGRCGAERTPNAGSHDQPPPPPWATQGVSVANPPGGYPPGAYPYGGYQPGSYPTGYSYPPGYGYYPMPQKTNSYAIASLILSILTLCGLGSVLGIIFGVKARREISQSRGMQTGDGLALAGIIIGGLTLALSALYVVFFFAIMFLGTTAGS